MSNALGKKEQNGDVNIRYEADDIAVEVSGMRSFVGSDKSRDFDFTVKGVSKTQTVDAIQAELGVSGNVVKRPCEINSTVDVIKAENNASTWSVLINPLATQEEREALKETVQNSDASAVGLIGSTYIAGVASKIRGQASCRLILSYVKASGERGVAASGDIHELDIPGGWPAVTVGGVMDALGVTPSFSLPQSP
ncbi:hypothetical protein [Acetobacter sp. DsW_063]|uniref:hypothetical protein n=1 Tax=Acetobacter sp. DsW_063 TaxID=1514894 RepID=UPI001178AE98|nr:hypothetical protein [Acetobacter sp. DsW_063]